MYCVFLLNLTKFSYNSLLKSVLELYVNSYISSKISHSFLYLDLISKNSVHQNVILIAKHLRKIKLSEYLDKNKINKNKIILLDQLSDPQNIGSIIRSASAFGFNAVGMLKNNSPFETSALIKASSGEIEKISLIELGNLVNEMQVGSATHTILVGAEIIDTTNNNHRYNTFWSTTSDDNEVFTISRPMDFTVNSAGVPTSNDFTADLKSKTKSDCCYWWYC